MKKRVLFICVHNSARSQMAEAWLNTICGEHFEAQSAGLEPGTLNPLAVQVMAEVGIDIFEQENPGCLRCLQIRPALRLRHYRLRRNQRGEMSDFPGPRDTIALELSRSVGSAGQRNRKTRTRPDHS